MILFRINNFHSKVAILGTVAEPFQNLSNHFKSQRGKRNVDHVVPIYIRAEVLVSPHRLAYTSCGVWGVVRAGPAESFGRGPRRRPANQSAPARISMACKLRFT